MGVGSCGIDRNSIAKLQSSWQPTNAAELCVKVVRSFNQKWISRRCGFRPRKPRRGGPAIAAACRTSPGVYRRRLAGTIISTDKEIHFPPPARLSPQRYGFPFRSAEVPGKLGVHVSEIILHGFLQYHRWDTSIIGTKIRI